MTESNGDLDDLASEVTKMNPETGKLSDINKSDLNEVCVLLDALDDVVDDEEVVEEKTDTTYTLDDIVDDTEQSSTDDVDLGDKELLDLELAIDREEMYQSQQGSQIESISGDGTATKKAARNSRKATPRVQRDLNTLDAKFFVLSGDAVSMNPDDVEKAKKDLLAARPAQVKVAEKFEGLLLAYAHGNRPSKYIMTAFKVLDANKKVSTADIIAALKMDGVGDGTARSQTGQLMALFPQLGIASRNGKELTIIGDSNIADFLRGLK